MRRFWMWLGFKMGILAYQDETAEVTQSETGYVFRSETDRRRYRIKLGL